MARVCVRDCRLCEAMAQSYPSETARRGVFTALLTRYLEEPVIKHHPISVRECETDGSLLCPVGNPPSHEQLPVYIQEVKWEVGRPNGQERRQRAK